MEKIDDNEPFAGFDAKEEEEAACDLRNISKVEIKKRLKMGEKAKAATIVSFIAFLIGGSKGLDVIPYQARLLFRYNHH